MTATTPTESILPLDLSGMFCPQVVLAVADCARGKPCGTRLDILSTAPLSAVDIPLFALKSGHSTEIMPANAGQFQFRLTLGPPQTPA